MSDEIQDMQSLQKKSKPNDKSCTNKIQVDPAIQKILNSFPYLIGIYDKNYNIVFLNNTGCMFSGFEKEDLQHKKCFELIGRTDPCENCSEHISKKADYFSYKTYLSEKSKYIFLKSSYQYNESNELDYIAEIIRFGDPADGFIGDTEWETCKSRNRITFDSLIKSIPSVVYFKDEKGRYLIFNKSFEKFVGGTKKI
ncbi:MAG: PAS domain-containing protein [Methanolobus sp.]